MSAGRVCILAILSIGWSVVAFGQSSGTYRFVVMGDPQFSKTSTYHRAVVDGYHWTSATWAAMPQLCDRIGAQYFFVCGDLFEYKNGDGATFTELWDNWDRYTRQFGQTRIEWVTGGHEFWGGSPQDAESRQVFLKRYPGKTRYSISDGDNLFILFDNIHDPEYLDAEGLQWLADTLKSSREKRIFFFAHVPPRNTSAWWPASGETKRDVFRSKMAALLEAHKVSAAFFGHEHLESYIGDTGGFPMFSVGVNLPLLVEISEDVVSYRWLRNPTAAHPMAEVSEAIYDRPITKWRVAAIPPGRNFAGTPSGVDPARALRLDDGSESEFQEIVAETGEVALPAITGAQVGGTIIAVGEISQDGLWARHLRLRSGVPGKVYYNNLELGSVSVSPERWHSWLVGRDKDRRNWATLVLNVTDAKTSFTLVPHTGP